jgi:hypothetical protein
MREHDEVVAVAASPEALGPGDLFDIADDLEAFANLRAQLLFPKSAIEPLRELERKVRRRAEYELDRRTGLYCDRHGYVPRDEARVGEVSGENYCPNCERALSVNPA